MINVALYARVSSEKQAQANTVESQVTALESRINQDGHILLDELRFIDNGYSGSNLTRPALEKLRDKVAAREIEKIYIHSPDRLARKYVHQMVLMEEFQKFFVEIVFLNYKDDHTPESSLLLQMQGMIAEYERTKIIERYRRGKLHSAKIGNVSSLSTAPYGYRYIEKSSSGMKAEYEINEQEAEVVRKIFNWIGYERLSLYKICKNLEEMNILSAKGNTYWSRTAISGIIKNPAYTGMAAFGKTKNGPKREGIILKRFSYQEPKRNYSTYKVDKSEWINIPVPAIIDEFLFKLSNEQLEINKKIARTRHKGTTHLLQGLLTCTCCHYSFYGKRANRKNKRLYYRCTGMDSYRFGGNKPCHNKQISAESLETAVWEEVKNLLKNPNRILLEYERRISELEKKPNGQAIDVLEKQEIKLKMGISRLIDSYTQGYVTKEEFEPRVSRMRENSKLIENQKEEALNISKMKFELTAAVEIFENFSLKVNEKLQNLAWDEKREIIRMVTKRIEIGLEEINIVFRVPNYSHAPIGKTGGVTSDLNKLQHCTGRNQPIPRCALSVSFRQSV